MESIASNPSLQGLEISRIPDRETGPKAVPGRDLSHVDAAGLSRLWPAGGGTSGDPVAWSDEELGELLRRQMAEPLDAVTAAADGPRTFGELFAHPHPPADLLRAVKAWAKPLMHAADGVPPQEVAGVLYFAATSCALTRCGERIANLDDSAVAKGARWALRRPWLDAAAAGVFREALAAMGKAAP